MKFQNYLRITVVAIVGFYPINITYADNNQKIITEKDVEFIIQGIDVDSGEFVPDKPQNKTQETLSNYMQELNQLNIETNKILENIGVFEFSSFLELENKTDVSNLKAELKKYGTIKKAHYDSMDTLLKKYRKALDYGSEQDERLAGTAQQLIEKMEKQYIVDLNRFYEFVLKYHEETSFTRDQLLITDQALVDSINSIWEKAVKSATELRTAQEMGSKIMGTSVKDLQKEINTK